jgi:hypothetical protein
MTQPATGNALVYALGLSRLGQFGVPAGGLTRYDTLLPAGGFLDGEESPSGEINPSGFKKKGVPGAKQGEFLFAHPLTMDHMLELFEHQFGSVVKDEPEADIFTYEYTPLRDGHINTDFWSLFSLPPVDKQLGYGLKFEDLELEIGDNEAIPVRAKGMMQHGTYLGPPSLASGTGTYALGPWIRGTVNDESAGSIWVRIQSLAPLTFKVLQKATAPSGGEWTAATTVFTRLQLSGVGWWQNVQSSSTGLDLGLWDENKDPLELIFPGNDAAHGDLDVADIFEFKLRNTWTNPSLTAITGSRRYTSAHWLTKFRAVGAADWIKKPVDKGGIGFRWPTTYERGNTSRYAFDITRPGEFVPILTLERSHLDTFFHSVRDRHERLEAEMVFEGRQLSATRREGLVATYPYMGVTEHARPASTAATIKEKITLSGDTNDDGDPPCVVTITTDRDWTPSA